MYNGNKQLHESMAALCTYILLTSSLLVHYNSVRCHVLVDGKLKFCLVLPWIDQGGWKIIGWDWTVLHILCTEGAIMYRLTGCQYTVRTSTQLVQATQTIILNDHCPLVRLQCVVSVWNGYTSYVDKGLHASIFQYLTVSIKMGAKWGEIA